MKKFSDILTIVLAITAVTVTALVMKKYWFDSEQADKIMFVENWEELVVDDGRMKGNNLAPVQIVMFTDYQCNYCKSTYNNIERLSKEYVDKVAISYRILPVLGEVSHDLAEYAVCANNSSRFIQFQSWAYRNQSELESTNSNELAQRIDLVYDEFNITPCNSGNDSTIQKTLQKDKNLSYHLGINSVPVLIINGNIVLGAISYKSLKSIIDKQL